MIKSISDYMASPQGASLMAHMSGVVGVVSYVAMAGYALWHGTHWDPRSFGEGFGLMSAGVGALIFGKNKGAPQ